MMDRDSQRREVPRLFVLLPALTLPGLLVGELSLPVNQAAASGRTGPNLLFERYARRLASPGNVTSLASGISAIAAGGEHTYVRTGSDGSQSATCRRSNGAIRKGCERN